MGVREGKTVPFSCSILYEFHVGNVSAIGVSKVARGKGQGRVVAVQAPTPAVGLMCCFVI